MLPLAEWRRNRLAALTAEDGWLNLTDRIDLREGRFAVGSAADNDVVLSVGPAHLGVLTVGGAGAARLADPAGQEHVFRPHPDAFPRLRTGGLLLEIHTVEGVPALRVRDLSPARSAAFAGLRHFPDDPDWVVRAQWVRLAEPESLGIGMAGGHADRVTVTHVARFQREGRDVTLTPTHQKGGKPMFVIRDATSGHETYAASRFLFGEDADEGAGTVTLDFNRAHNPPCAFTDLAICPLPPPGNVLPFAVRAGELAP